MYISMHISNIYIYIYTWWWKRESGARGAVPTQVRSRTATRIGEQTGDRQLMLVAGELANLGCS